MRVEMNLEIILAFLQFPQTPVFMSGHYGTAALPKLNIALEILDTYLTKTKWLAGPEVTLADLPAVTSISSLEVGTCRYRLFSITISFIIQGRKKTIIFNSKLFT